MYDSKEEEIRPSCGRKDVEEYQVILDEGRRRCNSCLASTVNDFVRGVHFLALLGDMDASVAVIPV